MYIHTLYLSDFVLLLVMINDRLRDVVERLKPLFDGLFIVVHSPTRCCAPQKPLGHGLIGNVKTQHKLGRGHLGRDRQRLLGK